MYILRKRRKYREKDEVNKSSLSRTETRRIETRKVSIPEDPKVPKNARAT